MSCLIEKSLALPGRLNNPGIFPAFIELDSSFVLPEIK